MVTAADYERWKTELSNWGRWGKDDQIGTLNLITPAKRREAAALVRDGVSVSLAADADTEKAVDNPAPYEFTMLGLGTDRIGVAYHGIAHTHLDAWNHISVGEASLLDDAGAPPRQGSIQLPALRAGVAASSTTATAGPTSGDALFAADRRPGAALARTKCGPGGSGSSEAKHACRSDAEPR
jgi:hypothetical protein